MDDVDIRVRLRELARFNHDADSAARHVKNIGQAARESAVWMKALNAQSKNTRISLGPFSTSMKGGALAVGALALGVKNLVPQVLGATEALGVMAGGAGAAGGVGVLALAQGATVAKLAVGGLSKALGGNAAALKKLSPQARDLFFTLNNAHQQLQQTATGAMLPGLSRGTHSALRNLPVFNRLVGQTGGALGGLASKAGGMLGSGAWGRDIGTVGRANVQILSNLGSAGLHLADGLRHVAVEAAPLAVWLSQMADKGALAASTWLENARQTGKMAAFFAKAKTDLSIFASSTGHLGHGLLNLFGAQDVDGTKTLRNLDRIMARFDKWSADPRTKAGLGNALVAEMPKVAGKLVGVLATTMAHSGAMAAKLFWQAFLAEDTLAKVITGGFLAKKLGLFGLGKSLGKRGGVAAGLLSGSKGATPANPLWVAVVNEGGGGLPGKGKPGFLSRFGRAGAKGLPGLAATAAAEVAGPVALAALPIAGLGTWAWLAHNKDGLTPQQRLNRGAQVQRSFQPLSGAGPRQQIVRTDAQGFPVGFGHDAPAGMEVHVMLDGRELTNSTATIVRRQRGRRAGP
jgi:hypothetical protein